MNLMALRTGLNITPIIILAMLTGLDGCYRPTEPVIGFDEFVVNVGTEQMVADWMKNHVKLSGADNGYLKYSGDFVYRQARALYNFKTGACSNAASLQVYCARVRGIKCGTEFLAKGNWAHERAWLVDDDGKVTITSNFSVDAGRWESFAAMVSAGELDGYYHCWRDEKSDKVLAESGVGVMTAR